MITWIDAQGKTWLLSDMTDLHIKNCIALVQRRIEKLHSLETEHITVDGEYVPTRFVPDVSEHHDIINAFKLELKRREWINPAI